MPISVSDSKAQQELAQLHADVTNLATILTHAAMAAQSDRSKILAFLNQIVNLLVGPSQGSFNPPLNLVKSQPVEVIMSVLELQVGQTAVDTLKFDEITPPTDGAVASDNPAVTISLDPTDHITWTAVAVSVTAAGVPASITYTGTSVAPDVGPAIVPPMLVTVVPVPVAEHGDFDPAHAVITGP
jgi:hypothetical protein